MAASNLRPFFLSFQVCCGSIAIANFKAGTSTQVSAARSGQSLSASGLSTAITSSREAATARSLR